MSHGEPRKFRIDLSCESGHKQTVVVEGMTREMADDYAGLLDGTSPMYTISPRDPKHADSLIGRCGICKSLIATTVEEC